MRKREREARTREAGKSGKREGTNVSSVFPGTGFPRWAASRCCNSANDGGCDGFCASAIRCRLLS